MTGDETRRQAELLAAVRAGAEGMAEAERARATAIRRALLEVADTRRRATLRRAEAIRAADDAGIPREAIAEAAGLKWPMTRQRWSKVRQG
ncbi:MAG: hypothetical protein LBK54_07205 [Propionibacteriaceae bacterium]|jgi:hypothetical protein|nr:hypothetical protein [Propionibacteriaceae bacterium]